MTVQRGNMRKNAVHDYLEARADEEFWYECSGELPHFLSILVNEPMVTLALCILGLQDAMTSIYSED